MTNNLHNVAIIGRANVGKSTLFNRLTESYKALVSLIPHTTRDRKYQQISWNNLTFNLIDTGGVEFGSQEIIAQEIQDQVKMAMTEADLIIFLVDSQSGIVSEDRRLLKLIRSFSKTFLLVANKADNQLLRQQAEQFVSLGIQKIVKISALNGSGTGDLLDEVVTELKKLKPIKSEKILTEAKPLKITIVGKTNVGKSTLLNSLLGEKRVIVSPIAFTTREAVDVPFHYKNQPFIFIDTAGLRKKRKVADSLEKAGASQSRDSIRKADIVLLITDVSQPLSVQDKMIMAEILQSNASVIIIANKWDLVKKADEKLINQYRLSYQYFFPFLDWAPIVFISAINKKGVKQILELILIIKEERLKVISANALAKFLKIVIKKVTPKGKADRGVNKGMIKLRRPFISHFTQEKTNPPIFSIRTDSKISLDEKYLKFIEKNLRQKFGFLGTPIKIEIK